MKFTGIQLGDHLLKLPSASTLSLAFSSERVQSLLKRDQNSINCILLSSERLGDGSAGRKESIEARQGNFFSPLLPCSTQHLRFSADALNSVQASAGEKEQDSKKPRRSQRISSQVQTTPLDNKSHLPSPLTHQGSTATEDYKELTVSPSEGRPSQIRHRTPAASSPPNPGLSSPPGDTQAFSQFPHLKVPLSHEVEDEEAEGVWGYLVPIDSVFGETLVLRTRASCPAPYPDKDFGKGTKKRGKGAGGTNYRKEEVDYEANKRKLGFPSGGYLIGRHPECGKIMLEMSLLIYGS